MEGNAVTVTFDDARAIVAASPSVRDMFGPVTVLNWGWENPDVFVIVAESTDGSPTFDAPALLIDKCTGKLTEVYGLLGDDPVPGLVPVGSPPE
jgi:hypothetical protein